MNQKFLIKFIRILVEITGILVDTIFLVKSTRILIFTRIIILIKILVISTRILINLIRNFWFNHFRILINITRKFWFVYFSSELLFNSTRSFFSVQWIVQHLFYLFSELVILNADPWLSLNLEISSILFPLGAEC